MSKGIMIIGLDRPASLRDIEMMKAAERGIDRVQVVEFSAPKLISLDYLCGEHIADMGPLERLAGSLDFGHSGRGNKLKGPFGQSRKRRRA